MAKNSFVPTKLNYVVPHNGNATNSNKNVNINQKTDIHVTGVSDPMLAAKNIRNEQNAVNLQMTRNSKGVFD